MDSQFRILGPIEIEAEGGRSVPLSSGRVLSFLALLLVHRGAIVRLDRVVDELWDGAGPTNAKNAVHVVASRLRAAVGPGIVVSEGGGYALRLPPGTLDADRFEERLLCGREQLAWGNSTEAAETLRQALTLWRGPALANVRDEGFAQPEVARLDAMRLACLEERVDADLECGRHAAVAGELEALVREHPFRERLRGQLMLALYHVGRQADALAAYRDGYEVLVEGLGIEPSAELRDLEAAILRQDVPAPAPAWEPSGDRTGLVADDRREVTCVCSQLAHADELPDLDPESLRAVLEGYYETARAVCERHGGSVAELRHDAVLAVFGMPVAHEDDMQRALRAAVELGARTEHLPYGLRGRAGVCTGDVVALAGRHGAPVIGEAVSAAERLARSAAGGEIRIAESTWQLVSHAAHATELPEGGFLLQDIDDDAPAIGRRLDRPLIGREDELGRLHRTFARVAADRSAELVAILGDPGIGKSRLVSELAVTAGVHGTVLRGHCPAYGKGITYWPLREIVLQAAAGRSVDELMATLGIPPSVAHRVAAAVGLEEGEAGEETGWAFLRLMDALARVQPLIIVIDDAHLAEPGLLDLLFDAPARLPSAPVLLVLVARAGPFEDRPVWEPRIAATAVLRLKPLSATASQALLAAIAGDRLDTEEERRITEAAAGNPLFLEQLVTYVGERPSVAALPPAIHALLAARLDQLDVAERSTLALGAVAGDAFAPDAVHALAAGLTRTEVDQACQRLVDRDLLIRGEPGLDGAALRFRHALIRDAAYASLAKVARARLHEQHASWLAGRQRDLPEADARIGFHLETACHYARELGRGPPAQLAARAGRRLAAAARLARSRGDLPSEIHFLDRSLALLDSEPEESAELLPGLVSALFEAGSFDRAQEVADQAVSIGTSLGLSRVRARATVERERIRLACHPETFRVETAVVAGEQASQTLRGLGDEWGLARASYLMSDLAWLKGDLATSHAHADRMLTHARRAGSGFDAATALAFMGWSLVEGPEPTPAAIARCDALVREAAGQRAAELTLLGCRAVLEAMVGGHEEARSSMARARAGLAELGLGEMAAYLAHLDVIVETLAGDPLAAERAVLDADAIVSESGDRRFLSIVHVDRAHAILAQGRNADAAEAVARIETVPAPCDCEWVIKRHAARALVAVQAGDHGRGLKEARAAVAVAHPTGLVVYSADAYRTLAAALQAAGNIDEAAAAARRALALDEAKGNVVAAAATRRQLASLD